MYLVTFFIVALVSLAPTASQTIHRCCPPGHEMTRDGGCDRSDSVWTPFIVTNNFKNPLDPEQVEDVLGRWNVQFVRPGCKESERSRLVFNPATPYLLLMNGSLWCDGDLFSSGSFCADVNGVIVCDKLDEKYDVPAAQHAQRVYINKCCFDGEAYEEGEAACKTRVRRRAPLTVAEFLGRSPSLSVLNVSNTFLKYKFPDCRDGYINTGRLSDHNSTLLKDGSLYLPTAKILLRPSSFCLEHLYDRPGDSLPNIYTCPELMPAPVNGSHIAPDKFDIRLIIYPPGLFLSVFFLAATLAVGCLLPTTHHMLHWRCQTCHVACLMVADFLLAVTYIAGHNFPPTFCSVVAVLMHVLFLAAFFWLNTMCFNIWWTFRDLRPTSLDKSQETWRLRMYELYAWGIPIIIAGTAAIFDNLPEGSLPTVLKPKFAVNNCWFPDDMEILSYFFGPIGILLFLNVMLFVLTARELTCGLWRSEVVKSTTERATLGRVCVKLVVVMGITWIADILSWAIGGPHSLWYITDILNSLHGVFIFIVVGCQPQIWAAMKRLWCFKGAATTSMNGNQQSCSQDVPSLGDSVSNNTQNTSVKIPLGETIC